MGKSKKRRYSSSEDTDNDIESTSDFPDLLGRIEKLERKVKKSKKFRKSRRKKHRRRYSSSSSESSSSESRSRDSRSPSHFENGSHRSISPQVRLNIPEKESNNSASTQVNSKETVDKGDDLSKNKGLLEEKVLDPTVLNVIGKRLAEERVLAQPVHNDFAVRWKEIIKLGLPKDELADLIKKHPPPNNCIEMDPPKLNTEFKSSLSEAVFSRDTRICARQEKLTACIAASAKVVSYLLTQELPADLPVLESLCDACRILCDIQHDETTVRRGLILSNYNPPLKEALSNIPPDEFLFGKDLAINIKNVKSVERSANDLKPNKNPRPSKNLKSLPRQQTSNPQMGSGFQKQSGTYRRQNYTNYRPSQHQPKQYHKKDNKKFYRKKE